MKRLYAISDIHGCFRTFHELVVNVLKLERSDKLVLLGDYIDRGEQSKEVVDFIIDLREKKYDITALTGNHEQMLLDSWYDKYNMQLWMMNSGYSTMLSFGIDDIRDLDKKYVEFFTGLEYYKSINDYLFVHAGFNDLAEDPFTDKFHMIWECRPSYINPVLHNKTIIHGHRPKNLNYVRKLISLNSKVLPIDTGCVYEKESGYGHLSALEVNSKELISIPYQ